MVGHTGFLLGIVAAVIAIVVAYVKPSLLTEATLTLLSLSLIIFLFAAERFSEALDFDDQRRHLRAISLYNGGVVLLLWGMGALMLVFNYLAPSAVLLLTSAWWLREIVRTRSQRMPRKQSTQNP